MTEKDSYDVLKKIEATFESYWIDREFKSFSSEDVEQVRALSQFLERASIGQISLLKVFILEMKHVNGHYDLSIGITPNIAIVD